MNNVLTREEVDLLKNEIATLFNEHHLAPQEGVQVLLHMATGTICYFAVDPKAALKQIGEAMIREAENLEETEDDE